MANPAYPSILKPRQDGGAFLLQCRIVSDRRVQREMIIVEGLR